MVKKRSILLHNVLVNLSGGANGYHTAWLGAGPDAIEPRKFAGISEEGNGDFPYDGTIDIQEGYVVVEIVSQPDRKRKKVRRTNAHIQEDSPVVEVIETYE